MARYDNHLNFKKNVFFDEQRERNYVWCFMQVDDKTLWVGCQYGYLFAYNIVTGATQTLHPPELEGSTIFCMEKDNAGNIWFGLYNGKIAKWDKKLNEFFPYAGSIQDSLKNSNSVTNIFIDGTQHCWVNTTNGFKEFNLEKRTYTNTWLPDKNNVTSISGKSCLGIEEYNDSILLIGTRQGGLNFFNKKTKAFSHLTTADGLQGNTIYAIKKDSFANIWFTTDYNLYKFNPAGKKFIPYVMESGLINSSFTATKFYSLQDGQWLTSTLSEAISFFPGKVEYSGNRQLKIEITGFKVFDEPLFIDSILLENKPVRLSYKENFFTVEFAAMNFSSLQQTNYYYRLGDIDKDWVNGGTKRFAGYTDLQPGEYVFEVKAENGIGSGETTSFKIIIAPPFWKTAWFKLLCLITVAALLYVFAKWRFNTIRKEEKKKMLFTKEMDEMEMKALRSQMNPHFIFNCINSIDALIQSNDKYNATVYLNKFAKLLRNILDSSKQNTVSFSTDIETLKLYIELEEFRHENKFKTVLTIENELLNSDYKVPPLIVQPFVENAILHGLRNKDGHEGILTINIKKVNDIIQYIITDNGIGREAAEKIMQNKESHYGMEISYDRLKLFNKEEIASVEINDLYSNGIPAGTKVKVNLNII
jgi:Histidine kinase/Y_Y_Y domain